MPITNRGQVTRAAYIKLGPKGRWEGLCLDDGTLRLAYDDVPDDLAQEGDVATLQKHFVDRGYLPRVATSHANQVQRFYSAGPETLWITFSAGYLWWSVAEGPVEYLGGDTDDMARRGSRLRRTRDGWHNRSVQGTELHIAELSGVLARIAAYRMTICDVGQFDYLIRKINDDELPQVTAARRAQTELLAATAAPMKLLTWQDFELLVDLVFSQSGWRRIGASGGTQKTVDIEMILPTTSETAFVQVKSRTNQTQFDDYVSAFDERNDGRMFYVYHTAAGELRTSDKRISNIGPDRLAELVLDAGLFTWLLRKAG